MSQQTILSPHCPHCGAAMSEGAGVYSWQLGIVTVIAVHCIAAGCRKALHFQIVPTPSAPQPQSGIVSPN